MPPSPAMRCSPGREPRAGNHKRGRSLESISLKQRDDDLALFNEVQSRERDNFLLQANDDFEDIFTNKLWHFSDYKLGINIPARGESSDLLHAEEEKNDYEWLLTPPDTPLFPSLDDEVPQSNLSQRGRSRTQPISISRSSTMEKSHRSSRGSASPNRVSLSPRSHFSTFEGRGRASSAPSASPPGILKPTTASLRSSPPSHKSSTPIPRISTPTPRRLSTGSSGTTSTRGISPVKASRGNSASPKVKAWQSNIPGFSTEVPPNLRTSLADRPASYVRGSSPASRNSRQSMSPTASRSISSSHSHERDRFSSHSKGSVASSAEDDMESLSSVPVGSAQRSNSRKVGGFQNNKASLSKKPSRTVSSSSAPKRSFDLALRQMDHRKGPQNMFRPLLSSVPSSTFHAGIASSPHHTRNSSVMTSSNASSGLRISGSHDPEVSQDDATSGYVRVEDCDVDDEMFVIEKDDALNDGTGREAGDALMDDSNLGGRVPPATLIASVAVEETINTQKGLLICSRCGCRYSPVGPVEKDKNLCADCIESYSSSTIVDPETSIVVSGSKTEATMTMEPQVTVVEPPQVMGNVKEQSGQHIDLVEDGQRTNGEPIWNFSRSRSEECEPKQVSVDFSNSKVETLEGAGISILLKRSSSIKGAVVRNTNFSASSISYDDLSYVRDSTNSMRSVSASSSVDFGHTKQTDTRFQRQLSSTKSEVENYKYEVNAKHRRSGSSLSGASSHAFHSLSLVTSTIDSFGRDIQENGTCIENDNENNLKTNLNQAHASAESVLADFSKFEEAAVIQKVEELGPDGTSASDTCTFGNDTTPNPTDVAEVPLDAISEGSPDSKCDHSPSSDCRIEEKQEDLAGSDEDSDAPNHTSNTEESIVLVERGLKGRSLTLEEATDTILFCSSIVQNLAHDAATIAIEKEDGSWPLVPATRKSDMEKPTELKTTKHQRSRQRKEAETDAKKAPNPMDIADQPKTRIVGIRDSNNGESKKPPMLESKCNCRIM